MMESELLNEKVCNLSIKHNSELNTGSVRSVKSILKVCSPGGVGDEAMRNTALDLAFDTWSLP